jgi:hypothetical protein
VVVGDDQWERLGFATGTTTTAASVIRRLIDAYLQDEDGGKHDGTHQEVCLWCRIAKTPDPVGERRTAGLRNQS